MCDVQERSDLRVVLSVRWKGHCRQVDRPGRSIGKMNGRVDGITRIGWMDGNGLDFNVQDRTSALFSIKRNSYAWVGSQGF